MLPGQRVFITGATGYVGRQLIPALIARGHSVQALVRRGSEAKAPIGGDVIVGDPFDRRTFDSAVSAADTFVQLVGVPHPSPSKARQFLDIDLRSALESIAAARDARIGHFIYVSVAHPAPIMRAYQAARCEAERALAASGLPRTILRPWYVLGPGHRWPYTLLPLYRVLERIPSTRESARRLGLVTLPQMIRALVHAVEHPPQTERIVEVPEIASRRSADL
jgi:uncharacterized protein YbjT (DUF2867 family)